MGYILGKEYLEKRLTSTNLGSLSAEGRVRNEGGIFRLKVGKNEEKCYFGPMGWTDSVDEVDFWHDTNDEATSTLVF